MLVTRDYKKETGIFENKMYPLENKNLFFFFQRLQMGKAADQKLVEKE